MQVKKVRLKGQTKRNKCEFDSINCGNLQGSACRLKEINVNLTVLIVETYKVQLAD